MRRVRPDNACNAIPRLHGAGRRESCDNQNESGPQAAFCFVLESDAYMRGSPSPFTAMVGPGGADICTRCSWPRKKYVTS